MTELRVAIVGGAGFMGKAHSLAWSHADMNFERATLIKDVLVDVVPAAAESAAAQLGWYRWAADWAEVVADPTIDIIDIATPPHLHAEIASAALANGKHVFCEKPLTNDAGEATALAEQAASAGLVAQVGFNYRHTPVLTYARSLIDAGAIGVPLAVRATYLMDAGFFLEDFGWRGKKHSGASGVSGDLGSHIIDMAEYLCGPIDRVIGLTRGYEGSPGPSWNTPVDDADAPDAGAAWMAEFGNGAMGTFSASFYSPGRRNAIRFELDGTAGALQFDWNKNNEVQLAFLDDPLDRSGFRSVIAGFEHPDLWYGVPGLGYGYVDGSAVQLTKFAASILDGAPAAPSFGDAAHVQAVVDALCDSAVSGAWTSVPSLVPAS